MSKPRLLEVLEDIKDESTGAIRSINADYAEVGTWEDGNTAEEDRVGYFVTAVGDKIRKATSTSDVRGVTTVNPGFASNAPADRYGSDGCLKKQYSYVVVSGQVPVRDDGTLQVDDRCIPNDSGIAVKSTNTLGYLVVGRVDYNRVVILIESNGATLQKMKSDFDTKIGEISGSTGGLDEKYAPKSHTHSGYLSKNGDTMRGTLVIQGIKLTEGVDYGSTLPNTAPKGKLFLLKP